MVVAMSPYGDVMVLLSPQSHLQPHPVSCDLDQGFGYNAITVNAHVSPAMCHPSDYD
jgi:hypothetical protein